MSLNDHSIVAHAAVDQEKAKYIVATAVRRRGFECKEPKHANRQNIGIKPHEIVWYRFCSEVTYLVTFTLDQSVDIERLQTSIND